MLFCVRSQCESALKQAVIQRTVVLPQMQERTGTCIRNIFDWLIRPSHAGTPWSTRTRRTEGVCCTALIKAVFPVQTLVSSQSSEESAGLMRAPGGRFSSGGLVAVEAVEASGCHWGAAFMTGCCQGCSSSMAVCL